MEVTWSFLVRGALGRGLVREESAPGNFRDKVRGPRPALGCKSTTRGRKGGFNLTSGTVGDTLDFLSNSLRDR